MKKAESYSSNLLREFLGDISLKEQEKTDKRMRLAAVIDNGIKAKGWKKSDLAKALNKRPSEISKWLSGTHNFNSDTLFDIEEALNIRLINLFEEPKVQVTRYNLFVSSRVPTSAGVLENSSPLGNLLIAQDPTQIYSSRSTIDQRTQTDFRA
ncbi:MAG TPA: helix-turn-helix transcriptional regulator [Syntrophomonas sp.]|nr:helix-turn-helix transcriptional regulator [Syntrophomonas sp.]